MNKARISRELNNHVQRLNTAYRVRHLTAVYIQDVLKGLEGELSSSLLGAGAPSRKVVPELFDINSDSGQDDTTAVPLSPPVCEVGTQTGHCLQLQAYVRLLRLDGPLLAPPGSPDVDEVVHFAGAKPSPLPPGGPVVAACLQQSLEVATLPPAGPGLEEELEMAKYTCAIHEEAQEHYQAQAREFENSLREHKAQKFIAEFRERLFRMERDHLQNMDSLTRSFLSPVGWEVDWAAVVVCGRGDRWAI